jgi:hypothetical protein
VIQILALAVAETPGAEFDTLACAVGDARHVYTSLPRICGDRFDGVLSYVGINPSASQARELLLLAAASAGADDLLIVYISSHGILRRGALSIPFNDARPNGFGYLEAGEISTALRQCPGQVLLILDCCFSGAALIEAHLRDVYDTPSLSVIASALPYGRANYGPTGSDFTLAFVRALERISGNGDAVTVSKVAEWIKQDNSYSGEILVNLAEGLSDLQLTEPPEWYQRVLEKKDFERRFLDRVAVSAGPTREMLWYSLDGMPDGLKLKIFDGFREHLVLREPSWLVRRAIGTVLSRIDDVHSKKREYILDFLNAKSWMHICIGLVSARNLVGDPDVAFILQKILAGATNRMDAIWLANLYLSDSSGDNLTLGLTSSLGMAAWGIVDLWKRYERHYDDPEWLARVFADSTADRPELLQDLRTHLECTGSPVGGMLGVEPAKDVVANELVLFQYQREPRGILAQTPVKWLVSSLYGSWRDQLSGDLREYLDNTEDQQIIRDVSICSRIPSVEHRVSICQELAASSEIEPEILDAARWAVTDPHPWVRRESLRLFPGNRETAECALDVATDRTLFPGYLDLIIEAHRNGADTGKSIKSMTKAERDSVSWATSVEASRA